MRPPSMGQSGGREAPQINGKVRNDAEDDAEDRAGCWDPIVCILRSDHRIITEPVNPDARHGGSTMLVLCSCGSQEADE